MDQNKDGVVTIDEFIDSCKKVGGDIAEFKLFVVEFARLDYCHMHKESRTY